jgi:hypothetical protein
VSALPVLAFILSVTVTPAPTPTDLRVAAKPRKEFLARFDTALASRDPKLLEALADVASWREAGYPDLAGLKMVLPEGPLKRYKDLSDTDVLYRDASGRSWCLRLRPPPGESGAWKAVIRASPCPRGGARVAPQWKPGQRETPNVSIWTLLECWPLPV